MHSKVGIDEQIDRFRREGAAAAAAHAAVNQAFRTKVRDRDPARYTQLLGEFRAATGQAFPHDVPEMKRLIDAGHARALDTAIAFLVADPWFFRSGYLKADLIRAVKRANLGQLQRVLLQQVVGGGVRQRDRQEFRHYCRLACQLLSSDFLTQIESLRKDADPDIRRSARWVEDALYPGPLKGHGKSKI